MRCIVNDGKVTVQRDGNSTLRYRYIVLSQGNSDFQPAQDNEPLDILPGKILEIQEDGETMRFGAPVLANKRISLMCEEKRNEKRIRFEQDNEAILVSRFALQNGDGITLPLGVDEHGTVSKTMQWSLPKEMQIGNGKGQWRLVADEYCQHCGIEIVYAG